MAIPLIFATNNPDKLLEVKSLLGDHYIITGLKEAGIDMDIPEPHATLEENAREKALTIHQLTGKDCFAEDTGLETETLGGAPGVISARYAGPGKSAEDNIRKLLHELQDQPNRKARFRTVISLFWKDKEYQFTGICRGAIIKEKEGTSGFGYDPIFLPDGAVTTFGQMTLDIKNLYSHRADAIHQMKEFLFPWQG